MKLTIYLLPITLLSILLTACAPNLSPNTYDSAEVGVVSRVIHAVVLDKRLVNIDNNSSAGGITGSAAGAVAGSAIGGSPHAAIIGAIGGALVGGVVGHAVDQSIHKQQGFEYILKKNDGKTISVVQTTDLSLVAGQHVLVIYGATTRIIPDNTK